MRVGIAGVGILGPGLEGWVRSAPVLRGVEPHRAGETPVNVPVMLPPRERRRTSPSVCIALNVAWEAVEHAGMPPHEPAVVFGTSLGEGLRLHDLLDALARPGKQVSPTAFHSSVHNAAAGYWSIGAASHQPSTSIAAHDFTFGAALLKSVVQVVTEDRPVLMAVFDAPMPEPLNTVRPMKAAFGVALVLRPERLGGVAWLKLTVRAGTSAPAEPPRIEALRDLWVANPAARALPLLEALAVGDPAVLNVQYPNDGYLRLELTPG